MVPAFAPSKLSVGQPPRSRSTRRKGTNEGIIIIIRKKRERRKFTLSTTLTQTFKNVIRHIESTYVISDKYGELIKDIGNLLSDWR